MIGCKAWLCGVIVAAGMFAMLAALPAWGQKSDAPSADEAALRQTGQAYLAALERNDRKAMADFWVPGGIYVDELGKAIKIKELLEQPAAPTAEPRPQIKVTGTTFRFLTADAAVEDGTSEVTRPGQTGPVKGRFSAVWVRQGGKWKLDSLRESRASGESGHEELTALEPLTGQWAGQTGDLTMQIKAAWNPAKTSLRRDITISSHGKVVVTAVQQIGWDPVHQQIRSTTQNDDGSRTDGIWSQEGSIWMVLARAVHPNGTQSRSTQIFRFIGRDTIVWKSIHVSRDNHPIPDLVITFTRGDKPKAAPSTPATQPPALSAADEAQKAKLLASESWRRVEAEFQQWSTVQVLYTPKQFEQVKARLVAEIKRMSPADLQKFIADLDAKLKLLLSKDAVEAQAWLGQYLSVMADPYRQKFVGEVPDFYNMTSGQIEDEFDQLKSKILSQQQAQAQFDAANAQIVKSTEASLAAARRAAVADSQAVGASTSTGGSYQSHYSPKQSNHDYHPPQMNFFEWGGRIGYNLPL